MLYWVLWSTPKFDDFLGGLKAQHIVILITMIYYREKIPSKVCPYVYPTYCTLFLLVNKTSLVSLKKKKKKEKLKRVK